MALDRDDIPLEVRAGEDDVVAQNNNTAETSFSLPNARSEPIPGVEINPPYEGFVEAGPDQTSAVINKWRATRQKFYENKGLLLRVSVQDELYVRWKGAWIRLSNKRSSGGGGVGGWATSAFRGGAEHPELTPGLAMALGLIDTPLKTSVLIGLPAPVETSLQQIDTAAQETLAADSDETLVKRSTNLIATIAGAAKEPEWVQAALDTHDDHHTPTYQRLK